jgi:hypothetical protein
VVSIAEIIFVISCQNTLILFEAIALSENGRSDLLITKLGISRKQYYSSIEKLMHTGLVGRISGRYRLTSLGKVLFSCTLKINTAIKYYWKLKAIDSIINVISPNNGELPAEEYRAIIDNIIDNDEIKNILGLTVRNNDSNNSSFATFARQPYQQQMKRKEKK